MHVLGYVFAFPLTTQVQDVGGDQISRIVDHYLTCDRLAEIVVIQIIIGHFCLLEYFLLRLLRQFDQLTGKYRLDPELCKPPCQ